MKPSKEQLESFSANRIFLRLANESDDLEIVIRELTEFLQANLSQEIDHLWLARVPSEDVDERVHKILTGWCTFDFEAEAPNMIYQLISDSLTKLKRIDSVLIGQEEFGDYVKHQIKLILGHEYNH